MILFLILAAVAGLVVGALARLLLPGPDPMGIGAPTARASGRRQAAPSSCPPEI